MKRPRGDLASLMSQIVAQLEACGCETVWDVRQLGDAQTSSSQTIGETYRKWSDMTHGLHTIDNNTAL